MPRRTAEEERNILQGWDNLEKTVVEAEVLLRNPNPTATELRVALQKVVTFYNLENSK
jgi:hypothetical protein